MLGSNEMPITASGIQMKCASANDGKPLSGKHVKSTYLRCNEGLASVQPAGGLHAPVETC